MGTALFAPLTAGVAVAQILATIFVYLSNQRILSLVAAIRKTGYFPLPAGPVTVSLKSFSAAFWGGLFFTLSIGAGLSLLTWAGFQLWHLLFRRSKSTLIAYAILWAGLLAGINVNGLVILPSLFCLLVPLSTAYVSFKTAPAFRTAGDFSWMIPLLTLAVLTGLWATQLDRNLFTTIRDHILLSNSTGRRVNDFYYRYTLYAAEAFKSFQQKTLRSCNLEHVADEQSTRDWEERLAHRDVLVLPQISRPDIRLIFLKKGLRLISADGQNFDTTVEEFIANPDRTLLSFSRATDRFAPLRRMTLAGLLLGFPILLFVMVYGSLRAAAELKFKPGQATWAASGICLIMGILLFLPMLNVHPITITPDNIDSALAADKWTQRVAALRYIEEHGLEIAAYPHYRQLVASPLVVERYWLARAMGKSRAYETHKQLLTMIRDPHPNVICQAFYALGQQGRRTAVTAIKQRLVELDHWYAQWYGYGALRKLGWQQTRSN
jgi:hypothetical protein